MKRAIMIFLISVVSACAAHEDVSRVEQTRREAIRAFGDIGPKDHPEAYDGRQDRTGMTMFRVYSEKPAPNAFSLQPPENFDNALVLDVAVDMKQENGYPLYRIGLAPRKVPQKWQDLWPSHIRIEPAAAQAHVLVARVPAHHVPGKSGIVWSEWTYCADCFSLHEIESATPDTAKTGFASLSEALDEARKKDSGNSPYAGRVTFTPTPGVGILEGRQAGRMAARAADLVAQARARLARIAPARAAYRAAYEDFRSGGSPVAHVKALCGSYHPNTESGATDIEAKRFDEYRACVKNVTRGYDGLERQEQIASFRAREARLADAAGLPASDRVHVQTLGEEMAAAYHLIDDARARFVAHDLGPGGESGDTSPASVNMSVKDLARDAARRAAPPDIKAGPALDRATDIPAPDTAARAQPPKRDIVYVARLIRGGADLDRGKKDEACMAGLDCETGAVIPLVEVGSYCTSPGEVSQTAAGWAVIVQRYTPQNRAEEMTIESGGKSDLFGVSAQTDKAALMAGIEQMRKIAMAHGGRRFFTSYQAFYAENTDRRGCRDRWRDAARHKVATNPDMVLSMPVAPGEDRPYPEAKKSGL